MRPLCFFLLFIFIPDLPSAVSDYRQITFCFNLDFYVMLFFPPTNFSLSLPYLQYHLAISNFCNGKVFTVDSLLLILYFFSCACVHVCVSLHVCLKRRVGI